MNEEAIERNTELFFKVADAIEREPRLYDQRIVDRETECGTAHCIAGWGMQLTGTHQVEKAFGLTYKEAWRTQGTDGAKSHGLFHPYWRPHDGLSVPDALRKIGEGASIEDVSA